MQSKSKITDYLHYGRENAIPTQELTRLLGFNTSRELQKQIERERAAGAVILSDTGGGYYLSEDPEELRHFIRTLTKRAVNTAKAVRSAKMALADVENKIKEGKI